MTKSKKERPLTEDEVRDKFLAHVWEIIEFWDKHSNRTTSREKMEGLAFSILSALDGSSVGLPAFIVAPAPHPEDKEFSLKEGFNWWVQDPSKRQYGVYWPENNNANVVCDIGGGLHESLYRVGREKGYVKEETEASGAVGGKADSECG